MSVPSTQGKRDPRRSAARRLPRILFAASSFALAHPALAQEEIRIEHQGIECFAAERHLLIQATIEPASTIRTARIFFRSELFSELYYVEMDVVGNFFQGVLPRPSEETKRIVYYIEAVDHAFQTARTVEHLPQVALAEQDCEGKGPRAAYLDGTPGVVVGATAAGAPAIPPGFRAAGIISTITSAGILTSSGGGGAGVAIAIGAAAGAGAGVAVLTGGDGDETVSPPPAATSSILTTTAPATTSVPSGELHACFTTTPEPPVVRVEESIRFDGSCSSPSEGIVSYEWNFGDGRGTREGRVVSRVFLETGAFSVTLRVADSAGRTAATSRQVQVRAAPSTSTVPAPGTTTSTTSTTSSTTSTTTSTTTTTSIPNQADIAVQMSGSSTPFPNPSVSFVVTVNNQGPRDAVNVTLTNALEGPFDPSQISVMVSGGFSNCTIQSSPPGVTCDFPKMPIGDVFQVTITVTPTAPGAFSNTATVVSSSPPDPVGGNNSASRTMTLSLRNPETASTLTVSFASELDVPPRDGRVKGQVIVNGSQVDVADSSSPFRHRIESQGSENSVEAHLLSDTGLEGRWIFDFRGADHFETGSLRVESGQIVSIGPERVVFRVSGSSGERIRFQFRLTP